MTTINDNPRIWKITKTNEEEAVYTPINANLPDSLPITSIEVDPENPEFIIIGTDYGLYTTNNGGGWWEKETRLPNVHITNVKLRHSDRKLFVFTYGRGAWTIDLKEDPQASTKDLTTSSVQVYPNPSSDYVQISGVEVESVVVYDAAGNNVLSSQASRVDVRGLKTGLYYFEIIGADKSKRVQKVVIN